MTRMAAETTRTERVFFFLINLLEFCCIRLSLKIRNINKLSESQGLDEILDDLDAKPLRGFTWCSILRVA